jgi:hypothetical protein
VPQCQGDGTVEGQQALGRVRNVPGDVVLGTHDLVSERFDQEIDLRGRLETTASFVLAAGPGEASGGAAGTEGAT